MRLREFLVEISTDTENTNPPGPSATADAGVLRYRLDQDGNGYRARIIRNAPVLGLNGFQTHPGQIRGSGLSRIQAVQDLAKNLKMNGFTGKLKLAS